MNVRAHSFQVGHTLDLSPPQSIEAEQALLGAILINNDAFGRVSDFLNAEHFSEEIHKRVYDVASQLIRAGKVATPITLKTFLGDADLGGMTIPQYLARLVAEATAIINAGDYGRTVYDLAVRRELIEFGERISAAAYDARPDTTCTDIAAAAMLELHEIAAASEDDTTRGIEVLADELMTTVAGVRDGSIISRLITTGYPDLDRAMNGYVPGTLVIVAGRPGMGKSIFASSSGYRCAKTGVGVLHFPLEIGAEQLVARTLADIAYMGSGSAAFRDIGIRATELDDRQVDAVREAHDRLRVLPIEIDSRSRVTLPHIAAKIAQVKRSMKARGVKLGVVFVDHLDFVAASDRYRGIRVQEIGEIVLGLKDVARSHNVCVVLLSQLSREVERRAPKDRRPTLADLRNSGDLEQVADVVALLFREEYYLTRSAEYLAGESDAIDAAANARGKIEIILGKTRAGPTPTIRLWCDPASSSISSFERGRA